MKCKSARNVQISKLKQVTLIWGPILALFAANRLPTSEAFCNCLTPMSMFKLGKHGMGPPLASSIYGAQVAHPGERANWYAQSQSSLPVAYGQQSPIKRFNLFQPKWRAGSLFGPKKWTMDWRNANFYRPQYTGYGWPPSVPQVVNPPQAQFLPPSTSGYQYGDQGDQQLLPQPQYLSGGQYGPKGGGGGNAYSPQLNANDGWSAIPSANTQLPPYNSQQQLNFGDSYGSLPSANLIQPNSNQQQQQQPSSNYNQGTKGGSGSKQQHSTTKKTVLMANGGYNLFDAYLGERANSLNGNFSLPPSSLGYTYPNWYSGVIDSPAKIAQQLYRSQKYRDSISNSLPR